MEQELEEVSKYVDIIYSFLTDYSFQIVGAILVFLLGLFVAAKASNWVLKLLQKKDIDITLSQFVGSGVKIFVIAAAAIIALGKLGISITPFVAAIGALSLGVGLALQGTLSNYGAGVSIIVTRPFVVGDTISVQGVTGVVQEVRLGTTVLTNEDQVAITIPNKHIIGEIIHNSSEKSIVELTIGIAYQSDPQLAIDTIRAAIGEVAGKATQNLAQVGINNFGDSSIDMGVRFWVPTDALFKTKYQVNMAIFNAFEAKGIEIPYPQRQVRLLEK